MSDRPHDHLVRHIFSHPEHARGQLQHMLPAALTKHIDWNTLEHVPASFVDAELTDQYADLLFRVRLNGRPLLCYLLLEHQSRPDARMPLRMLGYAVRAWEHVARSRRPHEKLPPLIPMLLCHTEGGWQQPASFGELLDVDAEVAPWLEPFLPDFRLLVDDLSVQSDGALRERAMTALGRVTLLALQKARNPEQLQVALEDWLDVARQAFDAPSGLAAAMAVIHYLLRDTEVDSEWMERYFQKLGPGAQEAYMTGAEILMERGRIEGVERGRIEGMEKGRSEGRIEGEAQIVLRQLTRKFGELPAHVTQRVRNGTPEELEQWADRLLTAHPKSSSSGRTGC